MGLWSIAGILAWLAAVPAAADTLSLAADAGFGGVTKPGRWTPVRIALDNTGSDVSGELIVSWGDSVVHRDVSLPSPSRKRYELYVRTGDVQGTIRVRLLDNGVEVRAADAPVHLVPSDERVTLCVAPSADSSGLQPDGCSVNTTPDGLPLAARGYDAVDAVIWPAGDQPVSREQRTALDRWRALRALEGSGNMDATPAARQPLLPRGVSGALGRTIAMFAASYIGALIVIGALVATRRGHMSPTYAVLVLLIAGASATALAIGRVGPGSDLIVHHSTVVTQLPGARGSLVRTRAVTEFPELAVYALRASTDDGFVQTSSAGRQEEFLDDAGRPQLRGRFALAERRAFSMEAFAPIEALGVVADGAVVRVTNLMKGTLTDCRFGDGFADDAATTLGPGQTVEAAKPEQTIGPVFSCLLPELPVALEDAGRRIHVEGTTRVFAYEHD